MIFKIIKKLIPYKIKCALKCFQILERDYGHWKTIKTKSCIDNRGKPLPWYTYPAIEYIKQLDFSEKTIFEYGSGNSSLYWGDVAKKVISVEHSKDWYESMLPKIKEGNVLFFAEEEEKYISYILEHDMEFDVIIIDGEWRFKCTQKSLPKLKKNGLMILDNSDWFVKTTKFLRDSGLIEVDMAGFGPINPIVWTTSFFFTREFDFKSLHNDQPRPGIGGVLQYGE